MRHSASVPDADAWQACKVLKEQPLQPGLSTPWMQYGYWEMPDWADAELAAQSPIAADSSGPTILMLPSAVAENADRTILDLMLETPCILPTGYPRPRNWAMRIRHKRLAVCPSSACMSSTGTLYLTAPADTVAVRPWISAACSFLVAVLVLFSEKRILAQSA